MAVLLEVPQIRECSGTGSVLVLVHFNEIVEVVRSFTG